jgi:hypothetical protein
MQPSIEAVATGKDIAHQHEVDVITVKDVSEDIGERTVLASRPATQGPRRRSCAATITSRRSPRRSTSWSRGTNPLCRLRAGGVVMTTV